MESDSDDNSDADDSTSNQGNETELIDVALATTASAEKNPWMVPPSVEKVSQFSKPAEIVNKITKENNSDTDDDNVGRNVTVDKNKNNELDFDELFDEIQEKRKLLPKVKRNDDGETEEGFTKKKSKKKRKLDKLKAKRKARQEAEELKKKQKIGDFVELGSDSKNDEKFKDEEKDENVQNDEDDELIYSSLMRKRTLEDLEGDWSDDDGGKTTHTKKRSKEDKRNTTEKSKTER